MARTARRPLTASLRAPRMHAARLALVVFTLFAFVLQTFAVQTHIHAGASLGVGKIAVQDRQPGKLPQDPANCPICQELLHAGAYVAPTAAGWQPVVVAIFVDTVVPETRAIAQIHTHGWNSRAPPPA